MRRPLIAVVLTALGCGGAPGNALWGQVNGRSFVVRDAAITTTSIWTSPLHPGSDTVILLADSEGVCDPITKPNTQVLIFDFADFNDGPSRPVTAAGTFTVSGDLKQSPSVLIDYNYVGSQCTLSDVVAVSGSVELNTIEPDAARASGSFNLVFQTGGALTGAFSATHACSDAALSLYFNQETRCP